MKACEIQRLETVFEQQMWCLGRDVGWPNVNLLIERGFLRHPPARPGLSGQYVLAQGCPTVQLSSVGIRFECHGRPLTLDREPMARQLKHLDETLLGPLGDWFYTYEQWAQLSTQFDCM